MSLSLWIAIYAIDTATPPPQRPPAVLPNLAAKPARTLDFTFMTFSSFSPVPIARRFADPMSAI